MKSARDVVSREVIDDLWGSGFTVIRRGMLHPDLFNVPQQIVPFGRSYQWWHLVHDRFHFSSGWAPVPASRHDGLFMPAGHVGDIEVNGLGLFEKSKVEVDQEKAAQIEAAKAPLKQWGDALQDSGFTGGARVVDQGGNETTFGDPDTFKRDDAKAIETTVGVPADLLPHMVELFKERDRLEATVVKRDRSLKPGDIATKFYAAVEADPAAPWWPTLRAILLPIAVQNVRKTLRSGEASSDVNVHPDRKESSHD